MTTTVRRNHQAVLLDNKQPLQIPNNIPGLIHPLKPALAWAGANYFVEYPQCHSDKTAKTRFRRFRQYVPGGLSGFFRLNISLLCPGCYKAGVEFFRGVLVAVMVCKGGVGYAIHYTDMGLEQVATNGWCSLPIFRCWRDMRAILVVP